MSNQVQQHRKVAYSVVLLALGMFGLAYASVPLYEAFCRVTGYGGTVKRVDVTANAIGTRTFKVEFNANTDRKLPWEFKPEQRAVSVTTGENTLIFYSAENTSNENTMGMATFNVTPEKAAQYFSKIACFCFDEQTLNPKEKVMMPVSFYIDPAIEEDKNVADVGTITLSYSFFEVKDSDSN